MTRSPFFTILVFALAGVSQKSLAQPGPTAAISIDRTATTPFNPGFSGYNTALLRDAVEYYDPNFQQMAALMAPGWLRFPAGTAAGAYNWQSGQMIENWVTQFHQPWLSLLEPLIPMVAGKGGMQLSDFANMASNMGVSQIVICVNTFTDTPDSAAALAAYVRDHNIPVAAWELGNEAYFYTGFFQNASDYADKMKPYRDAIKSVDSNAVVALFFSDAGNPDAKWDQALGAYPDQYWDAVSYHMYPSTGLKSDFATLMTIANRALNNATSYVSSYLKPLNPQGATYMVTEYAAWSTLSPKASIYEGVFASEYLLRMSSLPEVKFVGMHELLDDWGIQSANNHQSDVLAAHNTGNVLDTSTLDFGFFPSAQILGTAVANGVLKYASKLDQTTTQDSQSVAVAGGDFMPAIYSQAYEDNAGRLYLIVTNKADAAESVNVTVNGKAPAGTFPMTLVASNDPSAVNSASAPNHISIQFQTTQIPVTIPAFSVVRLDLTPPSPTPVTSVSAAAGSAAVAAEGIASAYGTGLASGARPATILPLATTLQSSSVQVVDSAGITRMAPLFYVSPGQINFEVPAGTAPGVATVNVISGAAKVATGTLQVQLTAPSIFTANSTGHGVPAALAVRIAAGGQQTPVSVFHCSGTSCAPVPIDVSGDPVYLLLYATGIRHRSSLAAVTCTVNGISAPVQYAGPQGHFAGLDQVNVELPKSLMGSGLSDVVLTVDGQAANTVQINIQ
jgi:uncharacterized protein (TIGR03437 family)